MNWKISTFLPMAVQESFTVSLKPRLCQELGTFFEMWLRDLKALLAGYLGSINDTLKEINSKEPKKSSQSEADETGNSVVVFSQTLVAGELTEQLMR